MIRTVPILTFTFTLLLALWVSAPLAAGQGVLRVDSGAAPGGDGSTWAMAFDDLQAALTAAASGTDIWVAQGTYRPASAGGSRSATFQLVDGARIYGSFPSGGGDGTFGARDPDAFETILSGDLNGDDGPGFANNGENSLHVVTGLSVSAPTTLDGVTITGGNANDMFGSGLDEDGGGLLLNGSSVALRGCTVRGNNASINGAVTAYGGNSVVEGCLIMGNASLQGAGLRFINGNPTVLNCRFLDNTTSNNGPGLMLRDGTVTNCVFRGNVGGSNGGGLFTDGNATIRTCTFVANTADDGAGIFTATNATVADCIFWNNTDAGGQDETAQISVFAGTLTVSHSLIQGLVACGPYDSGSNIGNIDADPRFVNAISGDFRLSVTSPCIGTGDPAAVAGLGGVPLLDITGLPRVSSGRIDQGAHESVDYPGTGEDFELRTLINGEGIPTDNIKSVLPGNQLTIEVCSPGGTFDFSGLLVVGQLFATGTPPIGPTPFETSLHINYGGVILLGPNGLFPAPLLPPGGMTLSFTIPFLPSGASIMIQAFALTFGPPATNGFFALTDGHELRYGPPPTITSVSHLSASAGTPITISGSDFVPGATVSVGGVAASPTSVTESSIVFPMPPSPPCDATLVVANPDGQLDSFCGFNPTPIIGSLSPATGGQAGGFTITVFGQGFTPGSTVTMGGAAAAINSITPTAITAITPAGNVGATSLVVTSPSACSATTTFTYTLEAPVITNVSPSPSLIVPGISVTISGMFFVPGATVTLGGTLIIPDSVTSGSVVFTAPATISCDALLSVTNPDGQSAIFGVVNLSPLVLGGNPSGPAAGGPDTLGIVLNVSLATTVTIGGTAAPIQSLSGVFLTVLVPPGTPGPATLVLTNPPSGGLAGCSFTGTYVYQ